MAEHPEDRRTVALLTCQFGAGCTWAWHSGDAAEMDLAWLNHARTAHWGMKPYERKRLAHTDSSGAQS